MASLLSKMLRKQDRVKKSKEAKFKKKMERNTLALLPEGTKCEHVKGEFWVKNLTEIVPYNSMTEGEARSRGFIYRKRVLLKPVGHERGGI